MHNPHRPDVLPLRAGVAPSCVVLPMAGSGSMLDFLAQRIPAVSRAQWVQRMQEGGVVDEHGVAVAPERPFQRNLRLYYYRALDEETAIPFEATVLHADAHVMVIDKPHFLPIVPAGRYLQNTLLVRLRQRYPHLTELSPLHRIDRDTAGLVLFSVQRATRGMYQALFRDRRIHKVYEAVAPWSASQLLPSEHRSRLEESGDFFLMHEVPGESNSHTRIQRLEQQGAWARYRLEPVTGKRHQLRVHMAALGCPLRNDPFYPVVNDPAEGDFSRPLQLLARSLAFVDPLTGEERYFESQRALLPLAGEGVAGAGEGNRTLV